MRICSKCLAACLLAGVLVSAPAAAGTVIEAEGSGSGISRMLISDGRLRMDSGGRIVLFDAGAGEMTFLDPAAKTYNTLDEADIRTMARQMEEMRAQIEKQLEQIPENQRPRMRRQMQAMLPGTGPAPEFRVESTGGSARVAGATCRQARVHRDGELAQEVCVADPADLGIPSADFDTMVAMFGFFEGIAGAMAGGDGMGASGMRRTMDQLGGMPARARSARGDNHWEVRSVERRDIAADRFAVPAGYRPGGAMGGMSQ